MSSHVTDKCRSLVWLRRDLRLHDHRALAAALAHRGSVCLIFVFDTDILARFDNLRDRRLTFLAEQLADLNRRLAPRGGRIHLFHGRAADIVPRIAATLGVERVVAGCDYEPASKARDAAVQKELNKHGIDFEQPVDHLIIPADRVRKGDGTPYKVYTPFSKQWRAMLQEADYAEAVVNDQSRYADSATVEQQFHAVRLPVLQSPDDAGAILEQIGYQRSDTAMWDINRGHELLADFAAGKMARYREERDFMARPGTSRLSPYLRFGLISIREAFRAARKTIGDGVWVNELIWREFYAMILLFFPESATEEFNAKYRGTLDWNRSEKDFSRFCEGRTGYPIVDAAVRELLETGWMHNRARMITACFLTKDLFVDWRRGEEFFAQHLMDYELASNAGGWQWAASTGTDAAPYFRVFNPWLQGKKFDTEGAYIRRFVPELKNAPLQRLHEPPSDGLFTGNADYPAPMVDHRRAKEKAIAEFKKAEERFATRDH